MNWVKSGLSRQRDRSRTRVNAMRVSRAGRSVGLGDARVMGQSGCMHVEERGSGRRHCAGARSTIRHAALSSGTMTAADAAEQYLRLRSCEVNDGGREKPNRELSRNNSRPATPSSDLGTIVINVKSCSALPNAMAHRWTDTEARTGTATRGGALCAYIRRHSTPAPWPCPMERRIAIGMTEDYVEMVKIV